MAIFNKSQIFLLILLTVLSINNVAANEPQNDDGSCKVLSDHGDFLLTSEIESLEKTHTPRPFVIATLRDKTKWVIVQDLSSAVQRFAGYLYLNDALAEHRLTEVKVTENKFLFAQGRYWLATRYAGEDRKLKDFNEAALRDEVGFEDFDTFRVLFNMRNFEGFLYVFDTDLGSFSRWAQQIIKEKYFEKAQLIYDNLPKR